MRPIAGLLLTVMAAIGAVQACAQPPQPTPQQRALLNAVFAAKPAKGRRQPAGFTATTTLAVRADARAAQGAGGVFAMPAFTGTALDQTHLLNPAQVVGGEGLVVWRTDEVSMPGNGGSVDTLRLSVGGVARAPGGVVLARPDALLDPDAEAFDVTYTRGWPSIWRMSAGRYALDVSPHAGFGVNSAGGTAEAGAMLRLGRDVEDNVMRRLGIKQADQSVIDSQGRWYLFAAASGRAVGLNMLANDQGGLQRAGWSNEPASALISDAQAGLGWRKGNVQASLGYVHRDVKSQSAILTGAGPANYHDSMVAFSLSFRPR